MTPKIADALSKGKPDKGTLVIGIGSPKDEDDEGDDDEVSDLELKAVKAFDKATTPEDRASALRSFVKACMAGGEY